MARAFAGGRVDASTIINSIINIFATGLRFTQLCIDLELNGSGDPQVFVNFLLLDKSITCFKLFITAYRDVHASGFGMFAVSCLVGLFLHLLTIVIYLYRNHKPWARAWISGIAIIVAIGVFLLGMQTPENYAWHNTAVEAILDLFVCLEAVMLVRNKMREIGGNDNLLWDLLMILADTLITVYLFVYYLGKTHSPWDAHTMLHLVGSCLAVVIGLGQIIRIVYKAYTNHVFAVGEEQAAGAAMDGNEGGDVEEQMVEEGLDVMVAVRAWLSAFLLFSQLVAARVFMREVETAVGAAIEDDGGDDDGEEVAPDEGFEVVVVALPA